VKEQESYLPGTKVIDERRKEAMEHFQKLGIPGKRAEDYKYSHVEKLFSVDVEFDLPETISPDPSVEKYVVPGLDCFLFVLVNGKFSAKLSQISSDNELQIGSLREAFVNGDKNLDTHFDSLAGSAGEAFAALNTTFAEDGAYIHVKAGTIVSKPVHILSLITDPGKTLLQPRHFIHCEKNSALEIFESSISVKGEEFIMNSLAEVIVEENARVHYYKLQNEGGAGSHICNTYARVGKSGHFDTNTVILNGAWIRNNLRIALDARNCESHLNGLFITNGTQHVDNNTLVDHRFPDGQSNQLYKGILSGKSTGVFNGKIFVKKDAQKTNAYQSSKNILLSDEATINAKPQLEIYADDVKCSHGSSTGKIDEEALFYLRSRGLSEDSARRLLLSAFANDVLSTIKVEAIRNYLEELVISRLEKLS